MISKTLLKNIIESQREELLDKGEGEIKREKINDIDLLSGFALLVSGIRRCGKSTLLRQIIKGNRKIPYFNFEDTRLSGFDIKDFNRLAEVFKESYGDVEEYYFDEIQNIGGWEIFIRSLLDRKKKVLVTGSNASLLSRELGTRLTGRHLDLQLFPFSFNEFLKFKKKEASSKLFEEYLEDGGFPEYLIFEKIELLQELVNDIIMRDIAARHNIKNIKTLKEMAIFLISNSCKEFSYNSLRKILNLGSTNSVISYMSYFKDSYLLFSVPKFDYSLKKQLVNPKKVYIIDNGIIKANSRSFSPDKGKLLENLVFISLKKINNQEIFYFQNKYECDFVVRRKNKINQAIQVCYYLNDENQDREINGLLEAMGEFNLGEGIILTFNQEDEFDFGSKKIIIKPTWKWMSEDGK
ncbi:MAG: ATP-binding protein [archaeon]